VKSRSTGSLSAHDAQVLPCTVCASPSGLSYRHPEADLYRCHACGHCFADQSSLTTAVDYGTTYGDVEHRNWFENPNYKLFEFIERQVVSAGGGRSPTVLDVGCGRGAFLGYLRDRHPEWSLTGVELSAFEPPPEVELLVGDFLEVESSRSFDAVVSLAVVEHVTDPHAFVQKAWDFCAPGGRVILMTLNEQSVLYDASRVLRRARIEGPFTQLYSTHHLNHFNKDSLQTLLEMHGMEVERRYDCHIPAAAIDFPPRGALVDRIQRAGAVGCFAAGRVVRRCYLQTVVGRRH
jgi:2-polyprenyl-3-methyl-5-hydroxy-6-metoxy-1,4-benzoquinol methylase